MFLRSLVSNGMARNLAEVTVGRPTVGIVATGTTIVDAFLLTTSVSQVATTAAGTGVRFPAIEIADRGYIQNLGANALLVYAFNASDVINALSAGAGFSVPAGKTAFMQRLSTGAVMAFVSA